MSPRRTAGALALAALIALVGASGCFDSLIDAGCADGWVAERGTCRLAVADAGELDGGTDGAPADGPTTDGTPLDGAPEDGAPADGAPEDGAPADGAPDATPDAMLDAAVDAALDAATDAALDASPTCPGSDVVCGGTCVDIATNPDHCGGCDLPCSSGLCSAGVCGGVVAGHVVVIGHDYETYRAANARVLGNAVSLGAGRPVRVMVWRGDAAAEAEPSILAALATGMTATGQPWQVAPTTPMPPADRVTADVLLIVPQRGAASTQVELGATYAPRLNAFIAAGGVVVGLAGPGSTTAELVRGAGLLDVTAGATASGQSVRIVAPTDAVAVGVPSPYLGTTGTTTFGLTPGPATVVVVETPAGAPVVIHRTAER